MLKTATARALVKALTKRALSETWQDGSVYDGNCWVHSLEDMEKLPVTEPPGWVKIERR